MHEGGMNRRQGARATHRVLKHRQVTRFECIQMYIVRMLQTMAIPSCVQTCKSTSNDKYHANIIHIFSSDVSLSFNSISPDFHQNISIQGHKHVPPILFTYHHLAEVSGDARVI
jgi:hypothetical protein